jgi:large subunit ribosomal protein L7/L12
MGCLIQIGGGVVGFILCIVVGRLLHTVTGSDEIAILGGIVTFAVCIVKGFDYGSKFGEKKPEELFAPPSKTTRGKRKATHSKPLGKRVALQYINASGEHRNAYVDSASAFRNHNKVKVNLWDSGGKMELVFERIKNPEVLGLSKNPQNEDEVVGRDCPNCSNGNVRAWKGEMRCWNCGHVLKEENILEQRDLESDSPPIIEEPIAPALEEPQAQLLALLALLRTRASTIAPVVEEPETQPEQPKEPEPEPVATEPATVNVVVTAIGMTSSEATKVLQKARPDLGTFDVYGLLRDFPKSVSENLPRDEAEKLKQELETAGCTVELK